MEMNDLILVSVDDHLIEPPDLFHRHVVDKYKPRAPRLETRKGKDMWIFEDKPYPTIGLNAVVGRPRNEYGMEPTSYAQMRKGCYDIHARIDDMNVNGILGSMCFPSFPSFAGSLFLGVKDKDLALATIRAYNDWHVHDWAGAYPGRFIPLALLPLWGVDLCVEEVKRVAKMGVHAVSFPDNPAMLGLPSLHNDAWDPFWTVCADNQVVICCHIGTGARAPHASAESPIDAWITTMPISISNSAADWLFSSVFRKHPTLRMALSEGGIGWIPYFLERADFTYAHHHEWTFTNFGKDKPSDVFKRNIITCFIDDAFGVKNRHDCGIDMITYECDYPHSDSTWPDSPEYLWRSLKDVPKVDVDKMTHLNAMREFHFDPIKILGRESCTVGALREKAKHVDTRPVAGMGGAAPAFDKGRPVTSGEVQKLFATAL